MLFELDCNGNQLVIAIHVQQANWSRAVAVLLTRKTIHYLRVTDVHMTSLRKKVNSIAAAFYIIATLAYVLPLHALYMYVLSAA